VRQNCLANYPSGRKPSLAACSDGADLIRTKGDEQLTVEQLTQEITPRGRGETPATHKPTQAWPMSLCTGAHPSFASDAATVPDEVKAELLLRIRRFVEEQAV
jgi:hypothetical protein